MIQNIQKGILHMEMINPQEWKKDLPAFKVKACEDKVVTKESKLLSVQ